MKNQLKTFIDKVKRIFLGVGSIITLISFTILLLSPSTVSDFLSSISFIWRFLVIVAIYGGLGFSIYNRRNEINLPYISKAIANRRVDKTNATKKVEDIQPSTKLSSGSTPSPKLDLPDVLESDDAPEGFWEFLESTAQKSSDKDD